MLATFLGVTFVRGLGILFEGGCYGLYRYSCDHSDISFVYVV